MILRSMSVTMHPQTGGVVQVRMWQLGRKGEAHQVPSWDEAAQQANLAVEDSAEDLAAGGCDVRVVQAIIGVIGQLVTLIRSNH